MIEYDKIKIVEIEASSYCNAACPLCPRNIFGYPYENGYTPTHLTLSQIKKIFEPSFVQQLNSILFEGNLGDALMNPELCQIIEFLKRINPDLKITVNTNGSLGTKALYENLAALDVKIVFGIDGLEDKHSIYRRNTNWHKIISNAKHFISFNGNAVWKMIKFNHNQHQIDDCEKLSNAIGFKNFILVDHGRSTGPVFDKNGSLEYTIGDWKGETDLTKIMDTIKNGDIFIEDISTTVKDVIKCQALDNNGIYVSAIGEVFPCCYMGFNPSSFGHGTWHQPVNDQIKNIANNNNALMYTLKECIEWFSTIPNLWSKDTFENGRLIVCDQNCGKCQKKN